MQSYRFPFVLFAAICLPGWASAASIAFSTSGNYDANFYEPSASADLTWAATSGGVIQKINSSAASAIYNTTSTGGSGGSGGTGAATANHDTFSNFVMKMDFSSAALASGGDSLGFLTKINAAGTAGYLAIFRMTGTGSADFRVWDSDSTAAGTPGSALYNQAFTVPAGSFATNTFYTFQLSVVDVAGQVQFTGSIFAAGGGAQIGNSLTYTDLISSSPVLGAGQVGIRFGSSSTTVANSFDNFSIEPIPEPSTSLLGLGGLALLFRRRR